MNSDTTVQKDIGEDLGYPAIWEIGIVFTLLCIIITVYLYGLYLRVEHAEIDRKRVRMVDVGFAEAVNSQKHRIETYGWSAIAEGRVSIPIAEAMEITAEQLTLERYNHQREAALQPAGTDTEAEPSAEDGAADSAEHRETDH